MENNIMKMGILNMKVIGSMIGLKEMEDMYGKMVNIILENVKMV